MKINLKLLKIFLNLFENVILFLLNFPLSLRIEWFLVVIGNWERGPSFPSTPSCGYALNIIFFQT